MRKGILLLCIVMFLVCALSSFAYSRYQSATKSLSEKAVCTVIDDGETIFESVVKQFIGAVKIGK